MRPSLAAAFLLSLAWLPCAKSAPHLGGADGAGTAPAVVEVQILNASAAVPVLAELVSGAHDREFSPRTQTRFAAGQEQWLRLNLPAAALPGSGLPVLIAHATRGVQMQIWRGGDASALPLMVGTTLSGFLGVRDNLYVLPRDPGLGTSFYVHLTGSASDTNFSTFSLTTLDAALAQGTARARSIALTFGALVAVSLAALLIWFLLKDPLFILYASMFTLQALYIVYLSGQGFDWPLLSKAAPLGSFAWNVPVGLSGAVACLFTREIADLKHTSMRAYHALGWFAVGFVLVTAANAAKFVHLEVPVNFIGNFMFVAAAVFTVVVCFIAWRRGNRAAGWFLIAWGLLEGFTMAAALAFLFTARLESDTLYYLGLPFSMVAASILIALGVADRLRAQRLALSDAERRARTDPLTGVLNRRSLIERLDAACLRAQARGLPITLLFIDLDHFKQINDTFGHLAGDACLRAIIDPIHAELRQSDVIGRYGGEEFVVILSSADAAAALPIAQRIRERVENVRVEGYGKPITLTCSIGVAASDTLGVWGEQLVARADAAVYVAKNAGRNQVFLAAMPSV